MTLHLPHTREARIATGIVAMALLLALASIPGDAPIVDEIPHIGAGYSYVTHFDMRLNPEHPPLVKDLAGLALVPLGLPQTAFESTHWTEAVNGQWNFGRMLLFGPGSNPDLIRTAARLPMLAVVALCCWLVFRWARERSGQTAALIAVTLLAFSPTVLAHGRFVTTDMAAATSLALATYYFLSYLRAPSRRTFVLASVTLGISLVSKFNTVLIAPFFVLVAILFAIDGRWRNPTAYRNAACWVWRTALVGIAAFCLVVWPLYILHTIGYPAERQRADTADILSAQPDNVLKSAVLWASDKPVIRAAGQWGLGLAMVVQRSGGGNTIYWLGQVVKQGGPWYFPIVYFLKEPLAWWILAAMALTALAFHRRRKPTDHRRGHWWSDNLDEWAWVLWIGIYWFVSIGSTLNIGVRHLLPVYPFTILFISGRLGVLLDWLRQHDRKRLVAVSLSITVLLGWYVFEAVSVFPYFLTYFNQIAGGPSGGYRYVVDSNLDWGQDARRLGAYVEQNSISRICVDYFGWSDAGYYLKDAYVWTSSPQWKSLADFKARNACDGWIAISATFFQNSNGQKTFADPNSGTYRWLIDEKPVAVIGNSIFVWHIE
jgi:hypothetical protein